MDPLKQIPEFAKRVVGSISNTFLYNPATKRPLPASPIYPENRDINNPEVMLNIAGLVGEVGIGKKIMAAQKGLAAKTLTAVNDDVAAKIRRYKTTVNIQDKNDLDYLRRILSEDNIKDIQSGKMINFRGTPYEDLAKVNLISETPKTIEQQLAGRIKDTQLKSDTFYHGTSANSARQIMGSGFKSGSELPKDAYRGGGYGKIQEGVSFAETPKEAGIFSTLTRDGEIVEARLKKGARVVTIDGVEDAVELADYTKYLKKQGVDAVYIGGGEKELVVLNTKAVTPVKSQLTDIYNQATKAPLPKLPF